VTSTLADRLVDLVRRWRTFWFRPESTAVLGVVRIAFGALMVAWTLSLRADLTKLVGDGSVMPGSPTRGFEWSLFDLSSGPGLRLGVWFGLLLASIALTIGWHSRVSALLVLVGLTTFQRGNPYVFNSGDALLRLEAIYLALAPCGAALSLDRRRTAGSFWSAQVRAPWALRLMQVQLSLIYLFSFLNKIGGETWREGTATSYALRMTDIGNFALPSWITMNALLMNVVTWSVLAMELMIGVLVWNDRRRLKVLAVGVVLHLTLVLAFGIAFFSFAMFVLYAAFIPPERVATWAAARAGPEEAQSNAGTPAVGSEPAVGGRSVRPHHQRMSPGT
jgi:hypothetical protein